MGPLIRAAAAGVAATVPMSAFMLAAHRRLPRRERYTLPPGLITEKVLRKAGAEPDRLEPRSRREVVWLAHLLYGAGMGAVYGAVVRRPERLAAGCAFGLAVWLVSYTGWLPVAGLMPPARRVPARRNALMVAAHLIWGACLALAVRPLSNGARGPSPPYRARVPS